MFIDEVEISVKAGKGGDGVASFRHEKFVPKGGPDGGDGGDGGDIIFIVNPNTDTLSYFNTRKKFKASDGERGKNKKMYGKNASDLILSVPQGTLIYELKNNQKIKITDLSANYQKLVICKGGIGGLGNVHFKSATHQTPREFTKGTKGEQKRLVLELQLIADVGIIGLPNAGKSTLISAISDAKPKIAPYPFTTLNPNLGVVNYKSSRFIIADIPGLIEGASEGKGLGHKFLRHVMRTKILVHLIDINSTDYMADFKKINLELIKFSQNISQKPQIITFNKIDLISAIDLPKIKTKILKKFNKHSIYFISTLKKINLNNLLDKIYPLLTK